MIQSEPVVWIVHLDPSGVVHKSPLLLLSCDSLGRSGPVTFDDLMKGSVAGRRTSWFQSVSIMNSMILILIFRVEKVAPIV